MYKIYWAALGVSIIALSALSYKFLIVDADQDKGDGRVSVRLQAGERDLVLAEMRAFLVSVQQIAAGIAKDDMPVVAKHARQVGRAAQLQVPRSLMGKLPTTFKQLGLDTHTRFDQMALDAEQMGDREHALSQLSALLENCVACHAAFRIDLEP